MKMKKSDLTISIKESRITFHIKISDNTYSHFEVKNNDYYRIDKLRKIVKSDQKYVKLFKETVNTSTELSSFSYCRINNVFVLKNGPCITEIAGINEHMIKINEWLDTLPEESDCCTCILY